MNNAASGKTMENVRKYADTKLVTTEGKKSYLVSETNYQTTKKFSENLLANKKEKQKKRKKKTWILVNKQVYLSLSILKMSKTVVYGFWYDWNQNMDKK